MREFCALVNALGWPVARYYVSYKVSLPQPASQGSECFERSTNEVPNYDCGLSEKLD